MGISTCIQHDAVIVKSHFLQFVDHLTLDITLIIIDLYVWIALAEFRKKAVKRALSINSRFTSTQKVQVWTVDNLYFHFDIYIICVQRYSKLSGIQNKEE